MPTLQTLLTIEEYVRLPGNDRPTELVRGRIVEMNPPLPRHGQICSKGIRILGNFADKHNRGHVVGNDSGVITERDPDTLRGADIAFYSYKKVKKGPFPRRYLSVVPDLIFEVRSPDDRWKKIQSKVADYLNAGVSAVCVLDEEPPTAYVYTADQPVRTLGPDDDLTFPGILPGFRVKVRRFFE
jgi:Uma2 family endonuclease